MVWQPEIDELKYRHQLAEQMGGPEGIERQHKRGKLTIRERIVILVDPGSFQQMGKLAGRATYDENNKVVAFTPSASVCGICTINGRRVCLTGGDFTVRGGAGEAGGGGGLDVGHGKPSKTELALKLRLPSVALQDAAGGSVVSFEQLGRTYIPDSDWGKDSRLLNTAPVVYAAMGSVAGGPAVDMCMSHFSIMVKDSSQVFPGGPPVVKAALGYDISKEDLGDYRIHTRVSGVIDNVADTEEEAFEQIRRFLSYLPDNVWEMPPRVETNDDPKRRDERLLSIIPRDKRKRYDPYVILDGVFDRDSFFEIAPDYGKARITGLAHANGYPVGVMINNPNHQGGSMDVAAGDKTIRLIQLCDTFHLPMVCLMDEPGFMVGIESEKQGIERAGARICCATADSKMPWISFILRQSYGVAGSLQFRDGPHVYQRYAWPSGHWGSIHIEGGTSAAFRRVIEAAPDPEAKRKEIERKMQALASPLRTAEVIGLDIIDPRDTRPLICEFIEMVQGIIKTQLGPGVGNTYRP